MRRYTSTRRSCRSMIEARLGGHRSSRRPVVLRGHSEIPKKSLQPTTNSFQVVPGSFAKTLLRPIQDRSSRSSRSFGSDWRSSGRGLRTNSRRFFDGISRCCGAHPKGTPSSMEARGTRLAECQSRGRRCRVAVLGLALRTTSLLSMSMARMARSSASGAEPNVLANVGLSTICGARSMRHAAAIVPGDTRQFWYLALELPHSEPGARNGGGRCQRTRSRSR
jgi:hypothetical protein